MCIWIVGLVCVYAHVCICMQIIYCIFLLFIPWTNETYLVACSLLLSRFEDNDQNEMNSFEDNAVTMCELNII